MCNYFDLDLAKVPKELKLILELLKENNSINQEIFQGIDWDFFINLSIHHRVYSILYYKVKDAELIPQKVVKRLEFEYKKNTFKMLFLSSEMESISKLFHDNSIRLIHLKGPILAKELYGDLSLRTSGDLDVIVPISDLEKVDQLMLSLGYEKDELETILNDWKWRHHHIGYYHSKRKIKVEVHWRLNPGPAKEPSFEELWTRKRTSTISASPVNYLSKEDLFLFLVSHGARHGWSRLRWLIDIRQMLNNNFEWYKAKPLLEKFHFIQIAEQAMLLCLNLLNLSMDDALLKRIYTKRNWRKAQLTIFYYEEMINLHSEPLPYKVSRFHKRYLFSIKSLQHKSLFILSFLYPYPMDKKILRLPKSLHLLYFPLRPILWIFRKTIS